MNSSKNQAKVFGKNTAIVHVNDAEPIQAETLYTMHSARIRGFLISRCQSIDLVEEVLQDVYLKLMSVDDLTQIKNPASFLVRVAHNLLIDRLRQQVRKEKYTVSETVDTLGIADDRPSVFDELLSGQRLEACRRALAELPRDHREIFLASRLDGHTHSQIAKKYGRSTSWVEKTIVRALAHCRRKLAEFDQK